MNQATRQSAPDLGAIRAEQFLREVEGRFHNDPPDRWKDAGADHTIDRKDS